MPEGTKLNGLAIRSWGDVSAIACLLALFVGVLAWGLKLETELNVSRDDAIEVTRYLQRQVSDLKLEVKELSSTIDVGILPRTEERVGDHRRRIERLERQAEECRP